jgi:molecular chaperone DnaK
MGKIVGIDLGTTNSVVAVMEGKEIKIIPNSHGSNLTPSVVAFNDKGERLVGILAKNQAVVNPRNTVYEIKRFMGRRASEVAAERKRVTYEVVGDGEDPIRVRMRDKLYTPQEISAMVLQDLKKTAEDYLGEKVTDAVITCPAYFNDAQRQATKEAGIVAGLNVRRIFNEPTAASLAYGLDKKVAHKIAVYDLGGGTFDISILEVDNEVIQVLSTNGDTHLGGADFDKRIADWMVDEFRKQTGIDLRGDLMAMQRLREAAEKAKCELSTMNETDVNLPFITADASGPKHLAMKLSRARLEQLIGDLLDHSMRPVEQALSDAKLRPSDVQEVVLVGGSTRIPRVQKLVHEFFGREPHKGVNPDEVVAAGAAVQAAILGGQMKDILLVDVTPLTLGVEVQGGLRHPLIPRNTPIPREKTETFTTAAEGQTSVEVHVVQGEREMASDCRSLTRFHLEGIPPAPRGVPKIDVTFKLDADGILNVTARDQATGKQSSVRITPSTGLSKDEIHRMVGDAEKNAAEDKKRRELVEARNHAEQLSYQLEQAVREHGAKVDEAARKRVEEAIERLKTARQSESVEEIKRAMDAAQKAALEIGRVAYEKAKASGASTAAASAANGGPERAPAKGEGKVIDADFETK